MNNRVFQIQCPLFRYAVDQQGTQWLGQQFSRTILDGDGQWRINCETFPTPEEAIAWVQAKHDKLAKCTDAIPRLRAAHQKRQAKKKGGKS